MNKTLEGKHQNILLDSKISQKTTTNFFIVAEKQITSGLHQSATGSVTAILGMRKLWRVSESERTEQGLCGRTHKKISLMEIFLIDIISVNY